MKSRQQISFVVPSADKTLVFACLAASLFCFAAAVKIYFDGGQWWRYGAVTIGCLAFLWVASRFKIIRAEIVESIRVLYWSELSILGKYSNKTVSFDQIYDVEFEAMTGGSRVHKRIVLKCIDIFGKDFTLPMSSSFTIGSKKLDNTRRKILEFLEIEITSRQNEFESLIRQVYESGGSIAAIKQIRESKGVTTTQAKEYLELLFGNK